MKDRVGPNHAVLNQGKCLGFNLGIIEAVECFKQRRGSI